MKWFEAKIQQSSDSSMASAAAWASGCRLMRAIKQNYSGVCKILDRLCEQLKSLQQTNQPKRKRNRTAPATAEKKNRTDPAASIHKEADRHLEPSSSEQHLKSVTALPVASEGDHDVTDGLDTDASRVDKSIDSEATCSDLARARSQSQKQRKKKETTAVVKERLDKMVELLLEMAADGAPLSCRDLYARYRQSVGVTTEGLAAGKIKHVLNLICKNDTDDAIEFVVLKREGEEAEKQFNPSKKRADQPPQVLAGMVSGVGGMNLYYYKNSLPRNA
jgi:hypothetical protein